MKFLKYLLVFTFLFSSCKTKKNMIDSKVIAKDYSAKKVAKKHVSANFNKKTINSKLKLNYVNGKNNQSLSVQLKIIKDEVIYVKGTKFITVFKAKITPTSLSYYSPYAKNYFTGDFSMIKKLLGVEINFEQLQNLFLGQSLKNVKEEKHTLDIIENEYVLAPKEQDILYNIFYNIDPSHFKITQQYVVNPIKNLRLDISYPSYDLIDEVVFPSAILIKAKNPKSVTDINLTYKSVEFDSDVSMSFNIPSGYKRLEF